MAITSSSAIRSFFFCCTKAKCPWRPLRLQLNEDELLTGLTVRLRREDALYLQSDKVLAALPPDARTARDLNALLKISTAINSVRGLDALQQQLLALIFEAVPAERGAILLSGENEVESASVFSLDRRGVAAQAVPVSPHDC